MFEGITKKRKNPWFNYAGWGLLVLVCGIFIFTGYSPNLDFAGNSSTVAEVNGDTISYRQFSQMYDQAVQSQGANPSSEQRDQIKKQVVENLVQRTLILQAAKKQGIRVSEQELADFIMKIPQFQEKGKFSLLQYKQLLKANNLNEVRFEEERREDLLVQKMYAYYLRSTREDSFVKSVEDEASQISLNIQFLRLRKDELVTDKDISPEEVAKFAKDNEKRVNTYYQEKKASEFTQEEKVSAQHILVNTSESVSAEQALKKIQQISADTTPSNFTEMAKKYSEDLGSRDKGGDLGYFPRGLMAKEFENVAFTTAPGKISAPFKSPFGYHILLVKDKKSAQQQELNEQTQMQIARKILKAEKAKEGVKMLTDALQSPSTFDAFMVKKGWKWDETGRFSLGDFAIPKLGDATDVLEEALSLTPQNPLSTKPIDKGDMIYVVKLKDLAKAPVLAKAKAPTQEEFFQQIMERQKSYEMFQGWIDQMRKSASVKINSQVFNNI